MPYAAKTSVTVDRSRSDLEATLRRYGATTFASGWDTHGAAIQFEINNRRYRFVLPLPNPHDRAISHTATGRPRSEAVRQQEYEQAVRQRWRALLLIIKAKLEAAETGITTLEEEMLANLVLPSGETVQEWVGPQVNEVYRTGTMPAVLPGLTPPALPAGTPS